jgi:hypothetical protein
VIWIMSVVSLGKQFDELVSKDAKLDIPETEAKDPSPTLSQS